MICYELFVLYASVVALQTGSVNLSSRRELFLHTLCIMTGAVVFILFYSAQSQKYILYTETDSFKTQQEALRDYNNTVESTMRIWLYILGFVVVFWAYQRFFLFERLRSEIQLAVRDAEKADAGAVFTGKRANTRHLLDLRQQGFDEIARPLEKYVAVFILFGIPAVLMATPWCSANSGKAGEDIVDCQHVMEAVLAFRTPATVAVYILVSGNREQFKFSNIGQLLGRVWSRFKGHAFCGLAGRDDKVGFKDDATEMLLIPSRDYDDDDDSKAEPRPLSSDYSSADNNVKMMGPAAFAMLQGLDDDAEDDSNETSFDGGGGGGADPATGDEVGHSVNYQLLED